MKNNIETHRKEREAATFTRTSNHEFSGQTLHSHLSSAGHHPDFVLRVYYDKVRLVSSPADLLF